MTTVEPATGDTTLDDLDTQLAGVLAAYDHGLVRLDACQANLRRLLERMDNDVADLPAVRRCACGCGQIVGPLEQWASHACYHADEGHDHEDDRE